MLAEDVGERGTVGGVVNGSEDDFYSKKWDTMLALGCASIHACPSVQACLLVDACMYGHKPVWGTENQQGHLRSLFSLTGVK